MKCGTRHLLFTSLPSQYRWVFTWHLRLKLTPDQGLHVSWGKVIKHIAARAHWYFWSLRLSPRCPCPAFPKEALQLSPDVCVKARDSQMLPYLAAWGSQAREHILLTELT